LRERHTDRERESHLLENTQANKEREREIHTHTVSHSLIKNTNKLRERGRVCERRHKGRNTERDIGKQRDREIQKDRETYTHSLNNTRKNKQRERDTHSLAHTEKDG